MSVLPKHCRRQPMIPVRQRWTLKTHSRHPHINPNWITPTLHYEVGDSFDVFLPRVASVPAIRYFASKSFLRYRLTYLPRANLRMRPRTIGVRIPQRHYFRQWQPDGHYAIFIRSTSISLMALSICSSVRTKSLSIGSRAMTLNLKSWY